jgi:hypothetical protein
MGLSSNPNHYSIIYLLSLLVHACGVQLYPTPVLRHGRHLLKLNMLTSVIHLIQTLPLPTQQQRHCYRPMTFVVFLLPAKIRGVCYYDMRSRPCALRPASTSAHANTNISCLGSPGFSFDELCLSGHGFSVFEHLADAGSYFPSGIFRPISQAAPAVANLQSRNQVVVDTFDTSPRLAAIDAATSSPPPTRARQIVPGTPSPESARVPITRHDRVPLVLRSDTVDREPTDTADLPGPTPADITAFRDDPDFSKPSETAASRDQRTRDFGRHDEFSDARSPTADFNSLYTDQEFPNKTSVDINYTQSPASRTSSSLFTSPTFSSLCT